MTEELIKAPRAASTESACASIPMLVLDTNVVLDWLVFRNATGMQVGEAVAGRLAHWTATASMRDELEYVLDRGLLDRWAPDRQHIRATWARWAHAVAPDAPLQFPTLRCSDADDQKFIDLARQTRATALLSRDHALLKLARRAGLTGLQIVTPEAWLRSRLARTV